MLNKHTVTTFIMMLMLMLMIIFIMMISWILIRFGNLGKLGVTELRKHCLQGGLERVHFLQVMNRII